MNIYSAEEYQRALDNVLASPCFSGIDAQALSSCETFCQLIQQAEPFSAVKQLMPALEVIADYTDDPNEASGFLMMFSNLGSGINPSNDNNSTIPIHDLNALTDWLLNLDEIEKPQAYLDAMDAQFKRVTRITEDDHQTSLLHRQTATMIYYALNDLDDCMVFGNYANENLDENLDIQTQIPDKLWQVFNSRPEEAVKQLIDKWWGKNASLPHDFFIALEWQHQGLIKIHKGNQYLETVAEFILSTCLPYESDNSEEPHTNQGIEVVKRYPFLEEELYQAIAQPDGYAWLISGELSEKAEYLKALFTAGSLNQPKIIQALDSGIQQQWDKSGLSHYRKLREMLL